MSESIDGQNAPPMQNGELLKYEMTPIALLKRAPRNARRHGKAQIAALEKSLGEFGMISPVVCDENNVIICGHGRVEAALRSGETAVPTLQVTGWNEGKKRLFALTDNRIAERSTWDETVRAQEFQELRLQMPDLDLTLSGFEHPTIELDIAKLEQTDWSDLDEKIEGPPAVPVTQTGDIWDFPGGHSLACGSCLEPEVVAAAVGGETVQLAAPDAPYNLKARNYSGKGRHKHADFKMGGGEMKKEEFRSFLAEAFAAMKPHLADGALIYGFMDGKHIGDLLEAGDRSGFEQKAIICWDKGKGGMGAMYRHAHELVALFKHGRAPHINNIMLGKYGRDRQTIWRYAGMNRFGKGRDRALSIHATIKPVQMICDLILDASHPGHVVFDGFGGSGTTLIAAEKMGRKAKLVELEPSYCDVAIARFIRAFGGEPVERSCGLSFSRLAEQRSALTREKPDAQ